jgi:C-8 sterol isomerase
MGYVFEPEVLHEAVRGVVGMPIDQMLPALVQDLARRYPGHINASSGWADWVFNNAGGAMGAMTVLHASITEYVIIFGTAIGTEGHTGRFMVDDYFFILDGEQWAFDPGQFDRRVYRPGDVHVLPRGSARGYRMPDRCWALEYARGVIPLMLPFGLADSLTSTLDVVSVAKTFQIYGRSVFRELRQGKI